MTAKRPTIVIAEPEDFSPRALEVLREVGDVEGRAVAGDEVPRVLAATDVFWFRLAHRIDLYSLGTKPRCRIIATPVTGLDHIDVDACGSRGIQVISLKGETEFLKDIRATAELTVALVLTLIRRIVPAVESVREGRWERDPFRGSELFGKTAGIVGMGRLGSIVARYLDAFGMRVIGYDPRSDFPHHLARRCQTLNELLQIADFVFVHASYGSGTHRLLGPEEFGLIKPGAVLVNTARGGIVDEEALIGALRSGRLSGAALDVVSGEPVVDGRHAIVAATRELPQLLVVPHIGGNTRESFEKTEVFLAKKVAAALSERR